MSDELIPECCFCARLSVPLMDIGSPTVELDGEKVPAFCFAEAWMTAAGTTSLHACRECFENNRACMGEWKEEV